VSRLAGIGLVTAISTTTKAVPVVLNVGAVMLEAVVN
jgi:hypothetical protein